MSFLDNIQFKLTKKTRSSLNMFVSSIKIFHGAKNQQLPHILRGKCLRGFINLSINQSSLLQYFKQITPLLRYTKK